MSKIRFKKTTENSFFGNYLYDLVVPKNHFLVKLKEEIDWESFLPLLLTYYKGGGEYGNPAFNPVLVLKMLFLAKLADLTERQTEEFANFNLPAKYFLGLGVDQKAPDHATLTVFKERLIKGAGLLPYEQIFTKIIKIALSKNIQFGEIQLIDSSHVIANVNTYKDKQRQEKKNKPPRDKDASWGVKHTKKVKTTEGNTVEVPETFYGYKVHTSLNAQTEITTSLKVTTGKEPDGKYFQPLVKKDINKGIKANIYSADKGYDDGDNHEFLKTRSITTAIHLKDNRTTTKSKENNEYWQKIKDNPDYKKGTEERYKVERSYSDGKTKHSLGRCQYQGLLKTYIQAYFTFAAMNLKKIIKFTTNISLKNQNYVYAYLPSS